MTHDGGAYGILRDGREYSVVSLPTVADDETTRGPILAQPITRGHLTGFSHTQATAFFARPAERDHNIKEKESVRDRVPRTPLPMSTLVDAVRAEANALTAKEGPLKNALTATATIITELAAASCGAVTVADLPMPALLGAVELNAGNLSKLQLRLDAPQFDPGGPMKQLLATRQSI